jgi:SAM-dependent methyltransferase
MARGDGAVSRFLVELSWGNVALADAELEGAVEALGGGLAPAEPADPQRCRAVELPEAQAGRLLASRLALARRVLARWEVTGAAALAARLQSEARAGTSASFRPWGHPRGSAGDPAVGGLARAWRAGGGTIDLVRPARRFCYDVGRPDALFFAEEVGRVDRTAIEARRMPRLPFQRPVSLAPHLARAAANLARVRPGELVVDPFVGTGALLLEAGLLGARLAGVDLDPSMVKGAIRNLGHFGLEAEALAVGDAGEAAGSLGSGRFDVVLTDPPYGRSSGSRGEPPADLVRRVLPRYAERLAPGGRMVVVLPGGPDPVGPPMVRRASVPDRVHRSLTREFRLYEREGPTRGARPSPP